MNQKEYLGSQGTEDQKWTAAQGGSVGRIKDHGHQEKGDVKESLVCLYLLFHRLLFPAGFVKH